MKYQMTFEEYCDTKDWISTLLVDHYERDCLDFYAFFQELLEDAKGEDVEITDADSVNYEKLFHDWLTDILD